MKEIALPPSWCSQICRNALNEVCVENCAAKRDCSGFEEKPNLKLVDMPRFPKTEGMSREEKFTSVTVYLAKVVEHLQEKDVEPICFPAPRPMRAKNFKSIDAVAKISGSLNVVQDENISYGTAKKLAEEENV